MKKCIVLSAVVFMLLLGVQSGLACSITSGGKCGGSACSDGKECTKVSDIECKCLTPKEIEKLKKMKQEKATEAAPAAKADEAKEPVEKTEEVKK